MKKILVLALVVIVAVAGGLYYIGERSKPAPSYNRGPVAVVVAPVVSDIFTDKIEALGTTKANESVNLTTTVTAKIVKIDFTDGMTVRKGRILVELVSDAQRANLRSALANAVQQKRTLIRIRGLVRARTLPTAKLDDQTALYEKAKADVTVARSRLRDRRIIAPFDGRLGLRRVSPGALVTPGTVITTLDDLSVIKLDFTVPEEFLSTLKAGQTIIARSDAYPQLVFKGKVHDIDNRVDPVSRAVIVRAIIANDNRLLLPGMLMRVSLIKNRRRSVMIPEQALVTTADRKYVFLLQKDNRVKQQDVTIGRRRPGAVEILKGLKIGQRVVTEGTMKLHNDSKVVPVKSASSGKSDSSGKSNASGKSYSSGGGN
ncbi:MAG: efflux RND transporter periplasmic adaptor subunit [Alphaproteobacteria bacterium]|nr:efflux RND transporter periplasmic adaptor subunit [Alphaproteobacteria bacterium]